VVKLLASPAGATPVDSAPVVIFPTSADLEQIVLVLRFPNSNRDLLREQLNQLVCLTADA